MKNTLILALGALIAAPALVHATPDVSSDKFRVVSTAGAEPNRTWIGAFKAGTPDEYNVDIWCVDQTTSLTNNTYDVWVTRLSSADFSKTKLGQNARDEYRMAGFMASYYSGTSVDLADFGLGNFTAQEMQSAIWRIMGYSGSGTGGQNNSNATTIYNYFFGYLTDQTGLNNWDLFDFDSYYVITTKGCEDPTAPGADKLCSQEFITNDPNRPQETVPEPATMTLLATGLAGMAAARRRRKS